MEAYRIGVKIAMSNGMSPVLALISRELLGINMSVKKIESGLGRWKVAMAGAAAAIGGDMLLRGLSKIADHGKEILHQQEQMRVAGMQNKEVVEATAKAWDTSQKIQVTTAAENLKHLRELRYATGDTEGAMAILNPITKANAILNAVKGGKGGTDQVFELVKALEQKGLATSEKRGEFLSYVNAMTQAVVASGGRVTPQMFQSAFKYGRTAMLGWDEQFISEILPRLIQSMSTGKGGGGGSGSGGPGNALMSAFAKVVQGQMPKKAAEEFYRMGLSGAPRHIKGSSQSITNIHGADMFLKDPYEWVQQILMPALAAHKITDQFAIIQEISKLFPVRTASQVIAEMGLQGRFREGEQASPFEKDRRLKRAAMGLAGYEDEAGKDPNTMYKAYESQKKNLADAVGVALLPIKLEVVKALTTMFMQFAKFASANPEAIKAIGVALGILGGALLVGGVVALAGALGGIGGAAAAAAAAIGVLVAAIKMIHLPSWFSDHSNAPAGAPMPRGGWHPHSDSGAPGLGRQGMNYIPPAAGGGSRQIHLTMQVDGTKLGHVVINDIVRRSARPVEGSPYFDRTWSATPLDTALG